MAATKSAEADKKSAAEKQTQYRFLIDVKHDQASYEFGSINTLTDLDNTLIQQWVNRGIIEIVE